MDHKSDENLSLHLTANGNIAAVNLNSSPLRKVPCRFAKGHGRRRKVKESSSRNEK